MGSSNNSVRLATNRMCKEITKRPGPDSDSVQASTQKFQEDAMWRTYWAEKAQDVPANPYEDDSFVHHIEDSHEDNDFVSHEDEDDESKNADSYIPGYSRFESAVPRDTHLYPTGKEGQTTKVRRYNPTTKKSDESRIHGKLKGRVHQKLKNDGLPPSVEDIVNNT